MLSVLKQFSDHLASISKSPLANKIQNIKQACHQLSSLQLLHPRLFAKNIEELIVKLEAFIGESNPFETIELYQIIQCNISTCHEKYRGNKLQQISRVFVLICCQIGKNIDEDSLKWFDLSCGDCSSVVGKEQFQQLNPKLALVLDYCECILKIVEQIDFGDLFENLVSALSNVYEKGNWKIQAAVYICIAKIYDAVQFEKLHNVVNLIYTGVTNTNPILRYYAIYALTNYSECLHPNFQAKYLNQFFPLIINGLSDHTEEIAIQWMRCLKKQVELVQCRVYIISNFECIINKICCFLEYSKNIIAKEVSISVLTALSTIPRLLTKQRVEKCLQICDIVLKNFKNPQDKTLVNKTLECLTSIIAYCDYKLAQEYITFASSTIKQACTSLSSQKFTIYICLRNLCSSGIKFNNWNSIYEYLLITIKGWEKQQQQVNQIDKIQAIETIGVVVECFGGEFNLYAVKSLEILFGLVRQAVELEEATILEHLSESIEKILEQCKSQLKTTSPPKIIPQILQFYIKKCSKYDADDSWQVKQHLFSTLKTLLNDYGRDLINKHDLQMIFNKVWESAQFLSNEKKNRIKIRNQIDGNHQLEEEYHNKEEINHTNHEENQNQYTEQSSQSIQESSDISELMTEQSQITSDIDKCRISLTDIFKSLMRLNPEEIPSMISRISHEIQKLAHNTMDDCDLTYVIMFICSLVEQLDYGQLKERWFEFMNYLLENSENVSPSIRQSVCYCLGLMIEKMPQNLVEQGMIDTLVKALTRAYSVPKGQHDDQNTFGSCQDNCISSVGKLIMRFHGKFDLRYLYGQWLGKLPLKFDLLQNRIQIEYLCRIVQLNPQILFDSSSSPQTTINLLSLLLKIFALLKYNLDKVARTSINFTLYRMSSQTVKKVLQWKIFEECQNKILVLLSDDEKYDLNALVENY